MEKLHLSWLVPIFYEKNILVFFTMGLTLKMVWKLNNLLSNLQS